MAGRTGGAAITAELDVPEQGFAEDRERGTVADVLVETGHLGHLHGLQSAERLTESGRG
jgi:hypothetical protein